MPREPVANTGEYRGRAQRLAHARAGFDPREHSRRLGRSGHHARLRGNLLQIPGLIANLALIINLILLIGALTMFRLRPHLTGNRWHHFDDWPVGGRERAHLRTIARRNGSRKIAQGRGQSSL